MNTDHYIQHQRVSSMSDAQLFGWMAAIQAERLTLIGLNTPSTQLSAHLSQGLALIEEIHTYIQGRTT